MSRLLHAAISFDSDELHSTIKTHRIDFNFHLRLQWYFIANRSSRAIVISAVCVCVYGWVNQFKIALITMICINGRLTDETCVQVLFNYLFVQSVRHEKLNQILCNIDLPTSGVDRHNSRHMIHKWQTDVPTTDQLNAFFFRIEFNDLVCSVVSSSCRLIAWPNKNDQFVFP